MTEKKEIKTKKTEKKEVKEKNEVKEVLMFTPVIETVGTRLKKCREEKKIKLSQISKALCIRESFLTALEEGDYEVFPALVYAGGFMRSYAVYLGMDAKEVMQQFHKETEYLIEKSADVPVVTTKNIIPSKKLLFSLVVLIGLGYALVQFLNENKEQEGVENVATTSLSVAELPVEEVVAPVSDVQNENVESTVKQEVQPELDTLSKELKEALPAVENGEENLFTGEVFGQKEGAKVSLLATNTVWVEVKSEDKIIFTRVMKKGESYNAPTLNEPVVFKTGNAGALSVYINGKFAKVLGRDGHVLKDVKLIPETFID